MRYQFQSEQGDYSFNSQRFTSVIKALISINAALFLVRYFMVDQFDLLNLGLSSSPKLWQPLTYMFIHGDFFHIFMNMFVLWMFGSELERIWGKHRFLKFYFITGIGSGLITMFFSLKSMTPIVGASGAVYGVLLAYGLTYPNRQIYLYGIIPIKSIWFVLGIGFIAFMSSFNNLSQVSPTNDGTVFPGILEPIKINTK